MAAAPRVSENPVVQQHYAAQAGLLAAFEDAADWLDTPELRRLVAALIREFQSAAISLNVDYYTDLRDLAEVPGSFRPPVIDPWDEAQLSAYLDTAVSDIMAESEQRAQEVATGQQLTLDAGIEQMFASMSADPRKPRWARVVKPGACSFCLMLATRGATYRSHDSADFRAHTKFNGRGGVCQCTVEPSFADTYEPPAHVRAAQSLYSEATAGLPRGADRANAFRRALYAQTKTTR